MRAAGPRVLGVGHSGIAVMCLADRNKVDSLLRSMSRVSLSELVGRLDDEDVVFGDLVAEIRLGLAPPETGGDVGELDAEEEGCGDPCER